MFILFFAVQPCLAKDMKVLVLPDTLVNKEVNSFVYPEASELITNDVINYLNIAPGLNSPTVSFVKQTFEKDLKTQKLAQKTLLNLKNNYNIDFEALKQINTKFKADLILLVTANLDTQNYFLRRTLWDLLNIPGATVVDPALRVSTQVYLINPSNNTILWQENYQKLISSRENRIIAANYSPQTEQIERIKIYSTKFLAPQITQGVQLVAYKVDEYSNFYDHPEIVKTNPLYTDSVKVNSVRGAVITGRYTKKETKKAAKNIKTNTNNFIEKQKKNAEIRKAKNAVKKEQKAKDKALKQAAKLKAKEDKNKPQQPAEVDVIMIKQEPKIDVEFTPVKPRLRESNFTINDL